MIYCDCFTDFLACDQAKMIVLITAHGWESSILVQTVNIHIPTMTDHGYIMNRPSSGSEMYFNYSMWSGYECMFMVRLFKVDHIW